MIIINRTWHEKVGDKNREDIIAAGKELFFKRTFLDVNIKEVCEQAHISRVTFYKYFKTIDELIFVVQSDILSQMIQSIINAEDKELNGLGALKSMLLAWVAYAKCNRAQMRFIILFDLYYETTSISEHLKKEYESFIAEQVSSHFLRGVIIRGKEDKSLRSDLDIELIGGFIFSSIMGILQRMSYGKSHEEDSDLVFQTFSQMYIESLLNYIKAVN